MNSNYEESEALHKKLQGKIEITPKMPITNHQDLSLLYTPGVAYISSLIHADPALSYEFTSKGNTIAIISDGSAVLGLGNIGHDAAMPVLEGKSMILKSLSGINAVPIILNTQDTESIISTITNIAPTFGAIMLEDISAPRCFEIETRLQHELSIPVIHDDQHGIAIVILAALINALKLRDGVISKQSKIVISGAGAAGIATTKLLSTYGFNNIILTDSVGIISSDRENLHSSKQTILEITNPDNVSGGLGVALKNTDVFIGVSAGNTVTAEMVKSMNSNPIIFALANPTPEIDPDLAAESGAFVVATGRSDYKNQLNNALVFPGLIKGILERRTTKFSPELFIAVAETLAQHTESTIDALLPDVFDSTLMQKICNAVVNFDK
jgi:malate dehydrogenase (oxaloacetate-decarboxylating)